MSLRQGHAGPHPDPSLPPAYATAGPGYPPPAGAAPGPAPQKQRSWFARHKILTTLLAVVLLVVLVNAFGGGEDAAPESPAASSTEAGGASPEAAPAEQAPSEQAPAEQAPAEAGIGTPVRDGKFEFTVTGVETGVPTIGDQYLNEQAQGQFVLVHLTVANIGDQAQYLSDSDQTLVDDLGREHSANSTAGIYLENNEVWLNEINPGNSVSGTLVFDLPVDAVPASIELHDSMFSGGVSVSLAQ
ncbi:DUF4352 domain-containing protein [Georgenia sp. AZ-5]|uniref:DUF4352 domain-containing protein n=1 Tax=Georgenia sp. AZ-5 TaxID=3367526 RepID=UPI0037541787